MKLLPQNTMKRNESNLRDLWDNIKHTNICIIGVLVGEERYKGPEKIFEEIIAYNVPNMGKKVINHVQKAQGVLGRINPGRITPRHIVIKLTEVKDRDKILKTRLNDK